MNNSKTSVALIGFMGTGKTAVGRLIAGKLNKRFVELDAVIEEKAGKTINRIFRDGEIAFREMEIEAVKEVAHRKNQVIACGGGVALNRINIDRLKQNAVIIYLTASPAAVFKRTSGGSNRPLLETDDKLSRIKELLKFRRPFYERAADITVNTTRTDIEAVAGEIIKQLRDYESFTIEK
jgi:shikimate kinase